MMPEVVCPDDQLYVYELLGGEKLGIIVTVSPGQIGETGSTENPATTGQAANGC